MYIYIYIYPSHFNCMGAVSVIASPDYKPCGSGPTRKQSTCEKDHVRAEMEQEHSKRDCAREQKWKHCIRREYEGKGELCFIGDNDSTTACIFAFGDSHDTSLTS